MKKIMVFILMVLALAACGSKTENIEETSVEKVISAEVENEEIINESVEVETAAEEAETKEV